MGYMDDIWPGDHKVAYHESYTKNSYGPTRTVRPRKIDAKQFRSCNFLRELCERARIHSLGRSLLPSLGRKLLFVFPLTNSQLDLTEEKNVVEWFGKCET